MPQRGRGRPKKVYVLAEGSSSDAESASEGLESSPEELPRSGTKRPRRAAAKTAVDRLAKIPKSEVMDENEKEEEEEGKEWGSDEFSGGEEEDEEEEEDSSSVELLEEEEEDLAELGVGRGRGGGRGRGRGRGRGGGGSSGGAAAVSRKTGSKKAALVLSEREIKEVQGPHHRTHLGWRPTSGYSLGALGLATKGADADDLRMEEVAWMTREVRSAANDKAGDAELWDRTEQHVRAAVERQCRMLETAVARGVSAIRPVRRWMLGEYTFSVDLEGWGKAASQPVVCENALPPRTSSSLFPDNWARQCADGTTLECLFVPPVEWVKEAHEATISGAVTDHSLPASRRAMMEHAKRYVNVSNTRNETVRAEIPASGSQAGLKLSPRGGPGCKGRFKAFVATTREKVKARWIAQAEHPWYGGGPEESYPSKLTRCVLHALVDGVNELPQTSPKALLSLSHIMNSDDTLFLKNLLSLSSFHIHEPSNRYSNGSNEVDLDMPDLCAHQLELLTKINKLVAERRILEEKTLERVKAIAPHLNFISGQQSYMGGVSSDSVSYHIRTFDRDVRYGRFGEEGRLPTAAEIAANDRCVQIAKTLDEKRSALAERISTLENERKAAARCQRMASSQPTLIARFAVPHMDEQRATFRVQVFVHQDSFQGTQHSAKLPWILSRLRPMRPMPQTKPPVVTASRAIGWLEDELESFASEEGTAEFRKALNEGHLFHEMCTLDAAEERVHSISTVLAAAAAERTARARHAVPGGAGRGGGGRGGAAAAATAAASSSKRDDDDAYVDERLPLDDSDTIERERVDGLRIRIRHSRRTGYEVVGQPYSSGFEQPMYPTSLPLPGFGRLDARDLFFDAPVNLDVEHPYLSSGHALRMPASILATMSLERVYLLANTEAVRDAAALPITRPVQEGETHEWSGCSDESARSELRSRLLEKIAKYSRKHNNPPPMSMSSELRSCLQGEHQILLPVRQLRPGQLRVVDIPEPGDSNSTPSASPTLSTPLTAAASSSSAAAAVADLNRDPVEAADETEEEESYTRSHYGGRYGYAQYLRERRRQRSQRRRMQKAQNLADRSQKPVRALEIGAMILDEANLGQDLDVPPGFRLNLLPYQRNVVTWMMDAEHQILGLDNGLYLPIPVGLYGHRYLWVAWNGNVSWNAPPMAAGGYLGHEMGLGKTVMAAALILARPRHPDDVTPTNTNSSWRPGHSEAAINRNNVRMSIRKLNKPVKDAASQLLESPIVQEALGLATATMSVYDEHWAGEFRTHCKVPAIADAVLASDSAAATAAAESDAPAPAPVSADASPAKKDAEESEDDQDPDLSSVRNEIALVSSIMNDRSVQGVRVRRQRERAAMADVSERLQVQSAVLVDAAVVGSRSHLNSVAGDERVTEYMLGLNENAPPSGLSVVTDELTNSSANRATQTSIERSESYIVRGPSIRSPATVIVAPVSLLGQWSTELRKAAPALSVLTWHGPMRSGAKEEDLLTFDVILLASSMLAKIGLSVADIEFHRIIYDESHELGNGSTARSVSAYRLLRARHRWALTGTPLPSTKVKASGAIDVLTSQLRALHARPGTLPSDLPDDIVYAWMQMHGVRHTVARVRELQQLKLPDRRERTLEVSLGDDKSWARVLYDELQRRIASKFAAVVRSGQVTKRYTKVMQLLSVLRMGATHPAVISLDEFYERTREDLNVLLTNDGEGLKALHKTLKDLVEDARKEIRRMEEEAEERGVELDTSLPEVRSLKDLASGPGLSNIAESINEGGPCSICLEVFDKPVVTRCGHVFCHACVQAVLNASTEGRRRCPLCRRRFRNQNEFVEVVPQTEEAQEALKDAEGGDDEEGDPDALVKVVDNRGSEATVTRRVLRAHTNNKETTPPKVTALLDEIQDLYIRDPTAKSVIFTQFQKTFKCVQKALRDSGIGFVEIRGDMTQVARQKSLMSFNMDDEVSVFLLSARNASVGLTLTRASTVYLLEPSMNPQMELQAIGRVHRMGQTRDVDIVRIIAKDTVDEAVAAWGKMILDRLRGTHADSDVAAIAAADEDWIRQDRNNQIMNLFRDVAARAKIDLAAAGERGRALGHRQ